MTKRRVKFECKNCQAELFEGTYESSEWEELKTIMELTKATTCCGKFQNAKFPVLNFTRDGEEDSFAGPWGLCISMAGYRKVS